MSRENIGHGQHARMVAVSIRSRLDEPGEPLHRSGMPSSWQFQSAPGSMSRENVPRRRRDHPFQQVSIRSRLDEPGELQMIVASIASEVVSIRSRLDEPGERNPSNESTDCHKFQSAPGSMSRENKQNPADSRQRKSFNPLPAR